jgi:hypothetical protein
MRLPTRALSTAACATLLTLACSTMAPPDARLRTEIFWEAAVACESRYRTLHLDRVDMDGNVTLHADAESRQELAQFTQCYRAGVQTRIDRRQQDGLPVPDVAARDLTVEID